VGTFVKICGLTTAADVAAAVAAGADAVGFVFAESPRRVSVDTAIEIARDVPDSVIRVAVMRHPTPTEWRDVATGFVPDWLQTEAADFAALDDVAPAQRMPVYRDAPGLDIEGLYREDRALFEAPVSGEGQRADWDAAARLSAATRLVLAGGLDANNVGDAIVKVRPWGVDVSSGVERSRGVKDPEKIAAFIAAVRALES
jgi:phosphoribosylanthranilate isomerase